MSSAGEGAPRAGRWRCRAIFAGLYFAEGGPIGFIWWALPVWLRTAGASPGEIARLVAWVAWPWALKFLWAPLVDLLRTPRFGLRGWILVSQSAMALTLVPLLFMDVGRGGELLLVLLLAHAVAAATQDAAIDTLAVRRVPAADRGAVNGWMQVGMLAARATFGGGAVLLANRIGERAVVGLLIGAVLVPAACVLPFIGPDAAPATGTGRARRAAYLRDLGRMLRRRALWAGFLLAATAGAGFEGLASLAGPLLIDRGASEDLVGLFFLVPTVLLMALGALLGGWASDRFGRRLVTWISEAGAALLVIAVGAVAAAPPSATVLGWLLVLLALVFLAAGAATASLYGLLMQLTEPSIGAMQFCTFMAAINLCYVWSTRLLGFTVERFGYGAGIAIGGVVSLLALPTLLLLAPASPSRAR